MKILVLRTDFRHHGEDSGYKQILKYIKPFKVLGVNERHPEEKVSILKKKYLWLFEFEAYKFRKEINLVHILYGEDYYRWSSKLFKGIPVVATFHQPADVLQIEVQTGGYRGRVGKITHLLNRNRFQQLAAAIVTSESQIPVLEKVMPLNKIHYIPLGVHLAELNEKFKYYKRNNSSNRARPEIITVGNWMRDWEFYFKMVESRPEWKFCLVNKNLEQKYLERARSLKNVAFHENVSDDQLYDLYLNADCQFLPVKGIAGSNAFLQGLALGCPIVISDIYSGTPDTNDFIVHFKKDSKEDCANKIEQIFNHSPEISLQIRASANAFSNKFSWENAAEKTMELYKKLI